MSCTRCSDVPDKIINDWKNARITELYAELNRLEAFKDVGKPAPVRHDPTNAWCDCRMCREERRINCAG